jgi:hypothetical protein
MDEEHLPLFVLPMVLFPGELQELRVFEPRYRQMLDTCVLAWSSTTPLSQPTSGMGHEGTVVRLSFSTMKPKE